MNQIEKFLNDKKENEYCFTVEALDGTHQIPTNDLQIFANEWVNGNLAEGTMITDDGRKVFPADQQTFNAVKEKVRIEFNISQLDKTNESLIVLKESTGLTIEDVARLIMNENNNKIKSYIETPIGNAFLIKENSPLYDKFIHTDSYLKKLNIKKGSMTLQDVVVMHDTINNLTFIVDKRKEAVELEDMIARSLTKNKTLKILDEYIDDVNMSPNQFIINTDIYASDDNLNIIKSKLNKLVNVCEHTGSGFDMIEYGFKNSIDNPANNQELSRVTELFKTVLIDTNKIAVDKYAKEYAELNIQRKQPEYTDKFSAFLVTKDLLSAIGSKNKSFYLKVDS